MIKKSLLVLSFIVFVSLAIWIEHWVVHSSKSEHTPEELYPLLQKSGRSLPELLRLDHIEEVYQMSTGDPKYEAMNYITKESETRIAEEAVKNVINDSEAFEFYASDDDYNLLIEYRIDATPTMKARLIETLDFKSEIDLWKYGLPTLLISRFIKLQPSGLVIVWAGDNEIYEICIHDSIIHNRWCDMKSSPEFIAALESLLQQTLNGRLPSFLSGVGSQVENDSVETNQE